MAYRSIFQWIAQFFLRLFRFFLHLGGTEVQGSQPISMEELTELYGEEAWTDRRKRRMIESVYKLERMIVREVMVPRTAITAIRVSGTIDRAMSVFCDKGRSRVPVYGRDLDDVKGTLYAKDILRVIGEGEAENTSIEAVMRPVHFVPETKNLYDLLQEFLSRKAHLAVVIDEYGGTAGVVTLEDIIEEIIGEVRDEYDVEEKDLIRSLKNGTFEVEARVTVDEINQRLGLNLPASEDYDTLGGFVATKIGRIPKPKEHFYQEGIEILIIDADKKSIKKVRINRHLPEKGEKP